MTFFVFAPIAFAFARLLWRRARHAPAPRESAEQAARMDRLEQAVDAVALEIERVGESQRYQSRVLAEANLMPALGAAQRVAEPLRMPDNEPSRSRLRES